MFVLNNIHNRFYATSGKIFMFAVVANVFGESREQFCKFQVKSKR